MTTPYSYTSRVSITRNFQVQATNTAIEADKMSGLTSKSTAVKEFDQLYNRILA